VSRPGRRITWFEFGLALFAASLPVGIVLMLAAPVQFFQAVGVAILGMGLVGLWISALGLQLEHPERWREIKASLVRLAAHGSARHPVQR
jgi:hypothetical protein